MTVCKQHPPTPSLATIIIPALCVCVCACFRHAAPLCRHLLETQCVGLQLEVCTHEVSPPHTLTLSHPHPPSPRHVVTMMNYNHDTQEIARPSEVLARVQSYMASLRTLELYVDIDMTRVLTAVLLQETQPLDSKGESTIASTYTSWSVCACTLL